MHTRRTWLALILGHSIIGAGLAFAEEAERISFLGPGAERVRYAIASHFFIPTLVLGVAVTFISFCLLSLILPCKKAAFLGVCLAVLSIGWGVAIEGIGSPLDWSRWYAWFAVLPLLYLAGGGVLLIAGSVRYVISLARRRPLP
jgi:hypothetical protein